MFDFLQPADPATLDGLSEHRRDQIGLMARAMLTHGQLQRTINNRAAVTTGLSHMHYAILLALATTQFARISELASYYQLDISVISRHVSAMEQAGYVTRERDPQDGRAAIVHSTPRGSEILREARLLYRTYLAELTADWSDEELDTFLASLARLTKNAGILEVDACQK